MEEGREGAAGALRARRFRAMLDRRKTHVAFLRICRREIRPTRAVVSSCSRSRSRSSRCSRRGRDSLARRRASPSTRRRIFSEFNSREWMRESTV